MPDPISNTLLRSLRNLFRGSPASGLSDADLLGRFIQARDEEAFELLMWRYSALVLNVCWQVLRDEQAVEDAFQATFLVLLRKAKAISRREALAGWLYRVAHRIALRARKQQVQEKGRQQAEIDLEQMPGVLTENAVDADLSRLLHEEVSHLPARYRVPIVCCYLQGQTYAEAAERLGWREGTVAGRLARARDLLRKRLARRGVSLGVTGIATHLMAGACEAARWSRRVTQFLQGLRAMAANETIVVGVSAHAANLAEGVISQMFWSKLKGAAFAMLAAVSLVGLGAAVGARQGAGQPEAPQKQAERRDEGEKKPAKVAEQLVDPLDEAMRRVRIRRNFKYLGLAMHNYHSSYRHLPLPASLSKDGKPLLSWRVAILPFIDQEALYKQFKLNEPWDSPNNKKLIAKMPALFASGSKGEKPGRTAIQYLVGPGAIFPSQVIRPRAVVPGTPGAFAPGDAGTSGAPAGPSGGVSAPGIPGTGPGGGGGMPGMPTGTGGLPSIPSISDGTSNTLLLVEGRDPVIWTKPDDIPYDPKKPIPPLGNAESEVFHAALADGSVIALPKRLDVQTLRALITANGGEVIDHKKFSAAGSSGGSVRQEALEKLMRRNDKLKQEASSLRAILRELKEEVLELRRSLEKEKLLAVDPVAVKLKKENEQFEKDLKETRDEARKLVTEIEKLKKDLRKKPQK